MNFNEVTLIEIEDYIQALDENVGLKVETIQDIAQAIFKQRGLVKKLNIPVVMPSTLFSLTWKDAQKEPPKEGGRYWCVVREINDLGTSYIQWNCSYNPNDIPRWTHDVIWWTELAPMP